MAKSTGTWRGADGKPVYLRILPDGTVERIPEPVGPEKVRVLGRVVNIDRERHTITFVTDSHSAPLGE